MKPTLYILCGIPGCGKSTWCAKKLKENTHERKWDIISRDEIRFSLVGTNEEYFSRENDVFNVFIEQIVYSLKDNYVQNTVADATHLNYKSRAKLINAIKRADQVLEFDIIFVYFDVPIEICQFRNNLRSGRARVPDDVIKNMRNSFTFPGMEFKNLIGIEIVRD